MSRGTWPAWTIRRVLDIDDRFVLALLEPLFPGFLGVIRELVRLAFKSVLNSELHRAIAGQNDVLVCLHHFTRDRDRVLDVLQIQDAAAIGLVIHDRCVQRYVAVAIRIRPESNAATQLVLGRTGGLFDCVDRMSFSSRVPSMLLRLRGYRYPRLKQRPV